MLRLFLSSHLSGLPAFPLEFTCLCEYEHMRVNRESKRREACIRAVHSCPHLPALSPLLTSAHSLALVLRSFPRTPVHCMASLCLAFVMHMTCPSGESGAHPACPAPCPLSSRALTSGQQAASMGLSPLVCPLSAPAWRAAPPRSLHVASLLSACLPRARRSPLPRLTPASLLSLSVSIYLHTVKYGSDQASHLHSLQPSPIGQPCPDMRERTGCTAAHNRSSQA